MKKKNYLRKYVLKCLCKKIKLSGLSIIYIVDNVTKGNAKNIHLKKKLNLMFFSQNINPSLHIVELNIALLYTCYKAILFLGKYIKRK